MEFKYRAPTDSMELLDKIANFLEAAENICNKLESRSDFYFDGYEVSSVFAFARCGVNIALDEIRDTETITDKEEKNEDRN